MRKPPLHKDSPVRIFSISALVTVLILLGVLIFAGPSALLIAIALIVIEVTFSFDNAVVNARVLQQLSPFWQKIFLTAGIAVAVFGMRIIFPIAIVVLTSSLSWSEVIHMSLYNPTNYEHALVESEPVIAAFGGTFLLMLSLHYFMNPTKKAHWLKPVEKILGAVRTQWDYAIMTLLVVLVLASLPANPHSTETVRAGLTGFFTYLVVHGLSNKFMPRLGTGNTATRTGVAGFVGFMYLELLDASFSLDGVIGAFALTNKVLLIAAGLGVGAIWIRSMTVYITRRQTLKTYRYLEQGAHYAILILALSLLAGLFVRVPGALTGAIGVIFIVSALITSRDKRSAGAPSW